MQFRRTVLSIIAFVIFFSLFNLNVYAHPGRTDSNGGHTDHTTGEYHYHHGQEAHGHYDIDGDGDLDCPYDFKTTSKLPPQQSADSKYKSGYSAGYDDGIAWGAKERSEFIVNTKLVLEEEISALKNEVHNIKSVSIIGGIIATITILILHSKLKIKKEECQRLQKMLDYQRDSHAKLKSEIVKRTNFNPPQNRTYERHVTYSDPKNASTIPVSKQYQSNITPLGTQEQKSAQSNAPTIAIMLIITLFFYMIMLVIVSIPKYQPQSQEDPLSMSIQETQEVTLSIPTQEIPEVEYSKPNSGELIDKPASACSIPLIVTASDRGFDFLVCLESQNNASNNMSFYVRAGAEITVNIPAGNYKISYQCGENWDNNEISFGPDAETKLLSGIYTIDESNLWKLELIISQGPGADGSIYHYPNYRMTTANPNK